MHVEGGTAPCVGVPDTLGEQTHRRARFGGARPRADEPAQRARLTDVARLSVAHAEVAALIVHGQENIRTAGPMNSPEVSCDILLWGEFSTCSIATWKVARRRQVESKGLLLQFGWAVRVYAR